MQECASLVIIDSFFPYLSETFRDAEYLHYFRKLNAHFFNPGIVNWDMVRKIDKENNSLFSKNYKQKLEQNYSLGYSVGLCTTYAYYQNFYKPLRLPFIFTLYPGFTFNPFRDTQPHIKELIESPLCKAVIVTQPTTEECLKKHNLNHKTTYINGGPVGTWYMGCEAELRNNIKKKICFVAHNYHNDDPRKGFLEFNRVAEIVETNFKNQFEWHVIGDWPKRHEFIQHHGVQSKDFLLEFYKTVDAVISPVKYLGAELDGFPTMSALEAGSAGCALLITDTHNQNECFADGEWLKIDSNPQNIVDKLMQHKDVLGDIGLKGQRKIKQFYGFENQVLSRYTLVTSFLPYPVLRPS